MLDKTKAKKQLSKDPIMKKVVKEVSYLNLDKSGNVFNELVKAIAYQQISYKAADTIYGRFLKLVGGEFFSPADVLLLDDYELRAVGFSRQKAQYSQNIARFFEEKDLFTCDWDKYSDQEILDLLTEIKGVGSWTVEMVLIFELQRPDVFPVKDLGIQQAMQGLYKLKSEKKALNKEMEAIAEAWKPHRTIASLYLWAWKRENPKAHNKP